MNEYFLEVVREIWDKKEGRECIQVCPDKDGLDMVEVRVMLDGKPMGKSIVFPTEQIPFVTAAMTACATEIIAENEKEKA